MGTITINIKNTTEAQFRGLVREEVGEYKGALGHAFEEALQLWIDQKQEEEISQRQLGMMRKARALGKYVFDRDELHERSN